MTAILQVEGASRSYRYEDRDVVALDHVDLEVAAGEFVVLTGPSGSGKTTLLHAIAGWQALDAGTVRWSPPVTDPESWSQVAVLPQRLGLLDEYPIGANITWPARLGACEVSEDTAGLIARLGLGGLLERATDEVSLGEQQRTALARALVLGPLVLLADEPTGHQDEAAADAVLATLEAARRAGTTIVVASHDDRLARRADRVVGLVSGRAQG